MLLSPSCEIFNLGGCGHGEPCPNTFRAATICIIWYQHFYEQAVCFVINVSMSAIVITAMNLAA